MWSDWESGPVAVDIDAIRHDLPSWPSDPMTAGLEARRRAVEQIDELLRAGHDVIVPQFLVRPDFIEALTATAEGAPARFVECAQSTGRSFVIDSFVARAATPATPAHADASVLVDDDDVEGSVGDMYDAFTAFVSTRRSSVRSRWCEAAGRVIAGLTRHRLPDTSILAGRVIAHPRRRLGPEPGPGLRQPPRW